MFKFRMGGGVLFIIALGSFSLAFCGEPQDLDKIVITKSKIHLLSSYSVESSAIKDLPFDSPVETLSYLPLDLQSRSPKADIQTDFSLRGSTYSQVLLLVDGQRINDPQTAHHNSDIPLTREDIEKIEVIPGVSSSLFGPDAIGGAINIIRKKPQEKKITLELSGGQHCLASQIFSASGKQDNLGGRLSIENSQSSGFSTDTDFRKLTATFDGNLGMGCTEFDLSWGYQEKEFGAYDFYTPGLGYQSKEWTKTYLLDTGLKIDKDSWLVKPNFLWRRHYDKFMLDKTLIRSRSLNHHRTDMLVPNIYFQNQIKFLGMVGFGFEYGDEKISSTNIGDHNRQHRSIFLDEAGDFKNVSLGLSGRLDDYDGFDKVYTGSGTIRYNLAGQNSLYLGVSRSMRVPSFTELYYSDSTTAGNAALTAEKSLNYQLGYDYKKEKLSAGLTFFLRQEKNFIDWVKPANNTSQKWQAENIADADVFGLEANAKIEINKNIALDCNYSYINKSADKLGYLYKYGPNYIKHLINGGLSFNLPLGVQTIGFTYKKKPNRDGWFLLNTSLSYNLKKNSQIFLKITNLLNVEYQEIEGIPQPRRWVEAGLRFNW